MSSSRISTWSGACSRAMPRRPQRADVSRRPRISSCITSSVGWSSACWSARRWPAPRNKCRRATLRPNSAFLLIPHQGKATTLPPLGPRAAWFVEREEAAAGGEKKPLPRGCDWVAESPPRGPNSIAPAGGGFFTSPIAAITTVARRRDAASHRPGRQDQACFLSRGDEGRGGAAEAGGPRCRPDLGVTGLHLRLATLKDVPIGYWPVLIMDSIHP